MTQSKVLALDAVRTVEGVIGGLLLLAVAAVAIAYLVRWRRGLRAELEDPGTPALARFVDGTNTDPVTFGGGAWSARVARRRDTVTYGYLAVAEEYESNDSGGRWCTLTVTLPGRVPFLVLDNRAAVGRSGVPLRATYRDILGDPAFDATYVVGAEDEDVVGRVLAPDARDVMLRSPVQRLMLRDSHLLLRTLDGVAMAPDVIDWLDGLAERFLASTPSFVQASRDTPVAVANGDAANAPLPRGFYGLD